MLSAKAFLLLGMKALIEKDTFQLENELNRLLPENVFGLLTSGSIT